MSQEKFVQALAAAVAADDPNGLPLAYPRPQESSPDRAEWDDRLRHALLAAAAQPAVDCLVTWLDGGSDNVPPETLSVLLKALAQQGDPRPFTQFQEVVRDMLPEAGRALAAASGPLDADTCLALFSLGGPESLTASAPDISWVDAWPPKLLSSWSNWMSDPAFRSDRQAALAHSRTLPPATAMGQREAIKRWGGKESVALALEQASAVVMSPFPTTNRACSDFFGWYLSAQVASRFTAPIEPLTAFRLVCVEAFLSSPQEPEAARDALRNFRFFLEGWRTLRARPDGPPPLACEHARVLPGKLASISPAQLAEPSYDPTEMVNGWRRTANALSDVATALGAHPPEQAAFIAGLIEHPVLWDHLPSRSPWRARIQAAMLEQSFTAAPAEPARRPRV